MSLLECIIFTWNLCERVQIFDQVVRCHLPGLDCFIYTYIYIYIYLFFSSSVLEIPVPYRDTKRVIHNLVSLHFFVSLVPHPPPPTPNDHIDV